MEDWLVGILKYKDSSLPKVILGNKVDLEEDRQVDKDEADAYFEQKGLQHYGTSAKRKDDEGIKESKKYIIETVYAIKKKEQEELAKMKQAAPTPKNQEAFEINRTRHSLVEPKKKDGCKC